MSGLLLDFVGHRSISSDDFDSICDDIISKFYNLVKNY
jgi:hypothetical protein